MNSDDFKNRVTSSICLLIYLLTSSLPVMLLITFIIVSTIKRESIVLLPVIMVTSIHPIFSVPIGILASSLGILKQKLLPKSVRCHFMWKCLKRLLTYSINFHLTSMALIVNYLYQIWTNLKLPSTWNYNNKAFDQCPCIERKEACENMDFDFQTKIMNMFPFSIPITTILVTIIITSFLCHVVHSIIIALPPPLTLYEYITGKNIANDQKQDIKDEFELGNIEDPNKIVILAPQKKHYAKVLRILCCFVALTYFVGVICSQFVFHYFAKPSNENKRCKLNNTFYICENNCNCTLCR